MFERLEQQPFPCMDERGCPRRGVDRPGGCPKWMTAQETDHASGEVRDASGCDAVILPRILGEQARAIASLAAEVSALRRATAEQAALAVERSVMAVAERQERARLGLDG